MTLFRFDWAFALIAAALLFPGCAQAELGGAAASVETDRGRMGARMTMVAAARYRRYDLSRANGGMVREFANADGKVFAVTWAGPGKPDLRTLLGGYFGTLQAGNGGNGRAMHSLRRPAQVDRSDLQIQTAGHMGWFRGVAFLPSLAPAGFSTGDLMQQP